MISLLVIGKILKYYVKHGELVKIKTQSSGLINKVGIVLDSIEMNTGFLWCEVMIDNERHWFDEIDLEVISATG